MSNFEGLFSTGYNQEGSEKNVYKKKERIIKIWIGTFTS